MYVRRLWGKGSFHSGDLLFSAGCNREMAGGRT